MFSLADPARINEVLTASGFERVASTGVNRSSKWGDDAEDAAAFFLGSGPVHALFADAEADTLERVREAITAAHSARTSSPTACGSRWRPGWSPRCDESPMVHHGP